MTNRVPEVSWVLEREATIGRPVHALLVCEPTIGDTSLHVHDDYLAVHSPATSVLSDNPRLPTSIFYKVNDHNHVFTEYTFPQKLAHMGITGIMLMTNAVGGKPLVVLCAYLPTNNIANPTSYRDSLHAAILDNIADLVQ